MGVAVELAPGDPTCPTACAPPARAQSSRWRRAQRRLPRDCREIRVTADGARIPNPSPSASNPSPRARLFCCNLRESPRID
eukprot:scaffold121369_cov62-Phaeocystis_antarctica.AAC.3